MRILIMLDPTNKYGTKGAYTQFRKFLASDGYLRLGPELFMRITPNRKSAEKHLRRVVPYAPPTGTVRVLTLTEKQFAKVNYLAGEPGVQEDMVGTNSHIMV